MGYLDLVEIVVIVEVEEVVVDGTVELVGVIMVVVQVAPVIQIQI